MTSDDCLHVCQSRQPLINTFHWWLQGHVTGQSQSTWELWRCVKTIRTKKRQLYVCLQCARDQLEQTRDALLSCHPLYTVECQHLVKYSVHYLGSINDLILFNQSKHHWFIQIKVPKCSKRFVRVLVCTCDTRPISRHTLGFNQKNK